MIVLHSGIKLEDHLPMENNIYYVMDSRLLRLDTETNVAYAYDKFLNETVISNHELPKNKLCGQRLSVIKYVSLQKDDWLATTLYAMFNENIIKYHVTQEQLIVECSHDIWYYVMYKDNDNFCAFKPFKKNSVFQKRVTMYKGRFVSSNKGYITYTGILKNTTVDDCVKITNEHVCIEHDMITGTHIKKIRDIMYPSRHKRRYNTCPSDVLIVCTCRCK